jgi:hypothetical protein
MDRLFSSLRGRKNKDGKDSRGNSLDNGSSM